MPRDVVLFIGQQFYPSHWDYIDEAKDLGCCRKVNKVPTDIVVGESKVYLLHWYNNIPFCFGYYTSDGIIKCAKQQQLIDELRNGVVIPALRQEHRDRIPDRGCGQIDPPSYYIVGPDDVTKRLGFRQSYSEDTDRIHILEDKDVVWFYGLKHFRGIRYYDEL